jgi:hypothetical protein
MKTITLSDLFVTATSVRALELRFHTAQPADQRLKDQEGFIHHRAGKKNPSSFTGRQSFLATSAIYLIAFTTSTLSDAKLANNTPKEHSEMNPNIQQSIQKNNTEER